MSPLPSLVQCRTTETRYCACPGGSSATSTALPLPTVSLLCATDLETSFTRSDILGALKEPGLTTLVIAVFMLLTILGINDYLTGTLWNTTYQPASFDISSDPNSTTEAAILRALHPNHI